MKEALRIASFNLRYGTAQDGDNHWNNRKDILVDTVRSISPDIMGVQECLPFQADELKMACHGLDHFGLGRYHSVADKRPHESLSGEHCSIFFRADKYSLADCGTFWHSDTPEVPASASWGNGLPRITTWGLFRQLSTDQSFFVFNTHLHWDEPYVSSAGKLIADRVAAITGGSPVLLIGDFNAEPDDELHNRLISGSSVDRDRVVLHDLWQTLGKSEENAGTCHEFSGVPNKRIDWILASDQITPISMDRIESHRDGRYPSDHFPIVAEVLVGSEE